MQKSKEFNATIRVTGSIAFRIKCPDYKYLAYENQRYLADLDFITYSKDIIKIQDMFFDMGWEEDQNVLRLFGNKRRIFYHPEKPIHSDIFLDKLRFCHHLDFKNRLEIDYPTISLIDLLLTKLQIVKINKKDLVDIMVLLRQYPISDKDENKQHIDGNYLAELCSRDWGWWKTTTKNLKKTREFTDTYLDEKDAEDVRAKSNHLMRLIEEHPRSLKWKIRSVFGEKLKWYEEVEEVKRG